MERCLARWPRARRCKPGLRIRGPGGELAEKGGPGIRSQPLFAYEPDDDDAEGGGHGQREHGDGEQQDVHRQSADPIRNVPMASVRPLPRSYRSLNSTATSTSTSTALPARIAGENRQARTASIAR